MTIMTTNRQGFPFRSFGVEEMWPRVFRFTSPPWTVWRPHALATLEMRRSPSDA